MKLINRLFILGLVVGLISCDSNTVKVDDGDKNQNHMTGAYLGQTPPGDTPELFAPGVVGDFFREHGSTAFTPDGQEVFWTRQVHTMTEEGRRSRLVVAMHMKQINGVWTKPAIAPFNAGRWNFITYMSADGKRIYFDSTQPISGKEEIERGSWFVEKNEDGWSKPIKFTALEKWEIPYSKIQVTNSGNIYFQSSYPKPALPNASWGVGLFCSKLINGEYQRPYMLDSTINSANYLDYAFHIDPDEAFVIFPSSRPGGYSALDLYISYKKPDGSWGKAINLGEKINSYGVDGSDWPFLSPDGKYLFFMTTMRPIKDVDNNNYTYEDCIKSQLSITNPDSKIHWVSADFIENLK